MGFLDELRELVRQKKWGDLSDGSSRIKGRTIRAAEAMERQIDQLAEETTSLAEHPSEKEEVLQEEQTKEAAAKEETSIDTLPLSEERSQEVEGHGQQQSDDESQEMSASDMEALDKQLKRELNKEARQLMKGTIHEKEGMIVHRPKFAIINPEVAIIRQEIDPIVDSLSRQILDLLENEQSETYQKGKYEGQRFNASRVVYGDLRQFDKKKSPSRTTFFGSGSANR